MKLQEDIRVKQELIQSRKGEIEGLQGDASQFMKQREELEREKGQYAAQLEQLDNEAWETEGGEGGGRKGGREGGRGGGGELQNKIFM